MLVDLWFKYAKFRLNCVCLLPAPALYGARQSRPQLRVNGWPRPIGGALLTYWLESGKGKWT